VQPRLEKRGHRECADESSGPVVLLTSAVDDPEHSLRRVSTSAARLRVSGKISLSETVRSPEYLCSQFECDPFRNRQPVEFLEQMRYIVIVPGPRD